MRIADLLVVISVLAENDYQRSLVRRRAIEYLISKKYLVRRDSFSYQVSKRITKKLFKKFGIVLREEE